MTIQSTTWSPDTCGCTVTYTWDDSVPIDERVHTPELVLVKCQHHGHLADDDLHLTVGVENTRKNRVHAAVEHVLTPGEFNWHYDDDRVLHVVVPSQHAEFQQQFDEEHGPGVVKVH